jgi:formate hydrogenlyase subunit 4
MYINTHYFMNISIWKYYMKMSIRTNLAGRLYNISAVICLWLVLAAFIVLPNALTSVKSLKALGGSKGG